MSAANGRFFVFVKQSQGVVPDKELLCELAAWMGYLPNDGEILSIDNKYYRILSSSVETREILVGHTNVVYDITKTKGGYFLLPQNS